MSGHRPPDEREALFRRRLRALSGAPLMTDGQELAAAASVADGRAAENELAALRHEGVADIERVQELRRRVARGDVARADLIASSRRLVVSLARRHPAPASATASRPCAPMAGPIPAIWWATSWCSATSSSA